MRAMLIRRNLAIETSLRNYFVTWKNGVLLIFAAVSRENKSIDRIVSFYSNKNTEREGQGCVRSYNERDILARCYSTFLHFGN